MHRCVPALPCLPDFTRSRQLHQNPDFTHRQLHQNPDFTRSQLRQNLQLTNLHSRMHSSSIQQTYILQHEQLARRDLDLGRALRWR
jgi:hypothetical protein